jgi:glycolate oxidase FAD binding subunit
MDAKPKTVDEVRAVVRQALHVLPRGGGTKPALSTPKEDVQVIDVTGLAGILEYLPGEYTFTALAGTRIEEVNAVLAEHGQYLPFDPLLVGRGATLGGTVAANTSGPGRYHYGGVRDFLIGVRYVDSEGHVVRGGGKVVKNAAGFDLPKLMVGSIGGLGVMVELIFKVFPRPEAFATLSRTFPRLDEALQAMHKVAASRLDVDALDLMTALEGYTLWVRLGGLAKALPPRLERLAAVLGEHQPWQGTEEEQLWQEARELAWVPAGWSLARVALTPGRIHMLEATLAGKPAVRRYSCGGQLAWLAWDGRLKDLNELLRTHRLSGMALFGEADSPRLGDFSGKPFYKRIKDALDPAHHFVEV